MTTKYDYPEGLSQKEKKLFRKRARLKVSGPKVIWDGESRRKQIEVLVDQIVLLPTDHDPRRLCEDLVDSGIRHLGSLEAFVRSFSGYGQPLCPHCHYWIWPWVPQHTNCCLPLDITS